MAIAGDIFNCHDLQTGEHGEVVTGIWQMKAREAATHPTVHRATLPQQKIIQPKISIVPRLKNPAPHESSRLTLQTTLSDCLYFTDEDTEAWKGSIAEQLSSPSLSDSGGLHLDYSVWLGKEQKTVG